MKRFNRMGILLCGGLFLLALGVSNYSGTFVLFGVGLIMVPIYTYLEKILELLEDKEDKP